ncbi:methenyltetrahydromethanopterin cyclohydrolase [Dehalobacter sp. DCM]|uniref:methenyltetrahydromethanopterin cyclohydrolase n=1 Tax=Dehalobacter sp. DCM TaxID=2907827 RepID=UPI0030821379|nr:methenyltetrahydromethanopterin cyclohydrolase [Dehalobacter sp. DCM]
MALPLDYIPELSPNMLAFPLVKAMIANSDQFQIEAHMKNGATVLDCGVNVEGSLEAGLQFAKVCLGGLANVQLHWHDFNGLHWPSIEVMTDHPLRACMASQFAGWTIKLDNCFFAASGPARAIMHKGKLFEALGCEDLSEIAVVCLEGNSLPTDNIVHHIAEACNCRLENLYILIAPTASIVGTVQVAARALETGLFRLRRMGYDLGKIISGSGVCPVSPVARNTHSALGRTNDAIFYGSTVIYYLRDDDDVLSNLVKYVPSAAVDGFGQAYMEYERTHDNLYMMNLDLFTPAVVWMSNLNSGNSFHSGILRPDILARSFGFTYS